MGPSGVTSTAYTSVCVSRFGDVPDTQSPTLAVIAYSNALFWGICDKHFNQEAIPNAKKELHSKVEVAELGRSRSFLSRQTTADWRWDAVANSGTAVWPSTIGRQSLNMLHTRDDQNHHCCRFSPTIKPKAYSHPGVDRI